MVLYENRFAAFDKEQDVTELVKIYMELNVIPTEISICAQKILLKKEIQ